MKLILLSLLALGVLPESGFAASDPVTHTNPFWIVGMTFVVALLPVLAGLLTSYIKVSIVLGMLRSALGAQQVPSGLVVMALSMALTGFIMGPTIEETFEIAEGIDFEVIKEAPSIDSISAFAPLLDPWRNFMMKHTGSRELAVFEGLANSVDYPNATEAPADTAEHSVGGFEIELLVDEVFDPEKISLRILIPAFVLSELKGAFAMGFVLLLPFLVVDLIVANVLVGMGMFMVSPVMISLPLKLMLFVVADGWLLLSKGLIESYMG